MTQAIRNIALHGHDNVDATPLQRVRADIERRLREAIRERDRLRDEIKRMRSGLRTLNRIG